MSRTHAWVPSATIGRLKASAALSKALVYRAESDSDSMKRERRVSGVRASLRLTATTPTSNHTTESTMNVQLDGSQVFFSHKRSLNELLQFKDDDSGYIEGNVFMTWPPRNRQHRINFEVAEDSNLYRFEVEVPHKEGIAFRPHERVCIALKGVKVVQRKESSAPHCFPIVLRFPDGVILKYLSGINAGKVVDAWDGKHICYRPVTEHQLCFGVCRGH